MPPRRTAFARTDNLVFASSSIHYTPKPYEFLTSLATIDAEMLMITRTPISDIPVVLLQNSALSANGIGEMPSEIEVPDKLISYPVSIMEEGSGINTEKIWRYTLEN